MAQLNQIDDNFSVGSDVDEDDGIGIVKNEIGKKQRTPRKGKTPKKKRRLNEKIQKAQRDIEKDKFEQGKGFVSIKIEEVDASEREVLKKPKVIKPPALPTPEKI